ncbi:MAG: PTS sugar transporter subunit IIA [Enterococcus faecalis]
MKKIYIASHGEMSLGIKDSLRLIAGESAEKIYTFSLTPGKNTNDFIREIESTISNNPTTQFIIMGDLFGASIVNSMVQLAIYNNAVLLSGVNLSMALQIVLSNENDLTDEDIEQILFEARDGIKRITLPKNNEDENNEF